MRASPSFQISLRRFGVWRCAVITIVGLGFVIVGSWLMTREQRPGAALLMATALGGVGLLAWAVSLTRLGSLRLRWDGQIWRAGASDIEVDNLAVGELLVAIDLGPWMMLRFEPATRRRFRRFSWIPVQRWGIESEWHSLRCALYSPRPLLAEPGLEPLSQGEL
jgi:hypothetical protein